MRWRKLGRVYCPDGKPHWLASHASVPLAERISPDEYRVYFGSRDLQNRSHTAWVVIDISRPTEVLAVSASPVLTPGALGCFDDSGAMPTWLVRQDDTRYLYYIGWNLGVTVPFRNAIGLAISRAGGPFERYAAGPIVDRTALEPHFCASCCVLADAGRWRMWYLSCTGWSLENGRPKHHYLIRYAESDDGLHWRRDGRIAIAPRDSAEYAISRPSVLRDGNSWRMWYSYRGAAYRIGYAESCDGCRWTRRDDLAGIAAASSGWDAEMVEYPHVFDHDGQKFMLYNGNGYGRTGFGIAVLEE